MRNAFFPIALVFVGLVTGCSLGYVFKQGIYQMKLLANAEPIEQALRSKNLDKTARKKLELIIDIRRFSTDKLALIIGKNYKDINLFWHHIIYTVSASDATQFKPYHWWFPIIGEVPYKGFFEESDAKAEEDILKKQGLDTQRGRIQGYSTLGYFADPVWPAMLKLSDDALIELIIHELTHRTAYFPNQTPFNETLANFVGKMGTRAFLIERYGEKNAQVRNFDRHQKELKIARQFFYNLYQQLEKVYESKISSAQKISIKAKTLDEAKLTYAHLPIDSSLKIRDWFMVNNAYLLSYKRYNYDEDVFRQLLMAVHGDFPRFFDEVRRNGNSHDPFYALLKRVQTLSTSGQR